LRRCAASSHSVGFRCRVGQFALPISTPDDTAFNRDSFGPHAPARHGDHEGTHRRPPTSCAHRLRKPDLAREPLTLSVARRHRRKRAPYSFLDVHPAAHRRETTCLGLRRTRSAVPTAGLGQRITDEPERLPSDRPRILRSEQAVAFVVHSHDAASHPCRLSRAWATSSKDGWSLRATPPRPARFRPESPRDVRSPNDDAKDAPHRLLQPTFNPSTLRIARFLGALRTHLPALAGFRHDAVLAHPRPMASGEPQVKLRLTANLQLQPCRNPSPPARSGYPDRAGERDAARSWRSFDRTLLTRCTSRPRRFQPRVELAT